MKQLLAILTVLAASAAWPALSSAATFKGVVVAKERGTLLVASSNGSVTAAPGRASVGSRVSVSGRSVRVVGRASRAVVRGVVAGRTATTMFLSAGGHLLAVRTARHPASVVGTPAPRSRSRARSSLRRCTSRTAALSTTRATTIWGRLMRSPSRRLSLRSPPAR